jgi:phosphinothricin acetyltransferase
MDTIDTVEAQAGEFAPEPLGDRASIRHATFKDVPQLVSIMNEAIAGGTGLDEKPKTIHQIERWYEEHDKRYVVLVAADETGHVLGCGSLNRYHPEFDSCAGVADVTCFLGIGAQRRGLGSRLMTELERHARQHGFHKLSARTSPASRSVRRLLRKFAFRVVGVHRRDAVIGGNYIDVMLLEKLLSPGRYRVGVPSDGE